MEFVDNRPIIEKIGDKVRCVETVKIYFDSRKQALIHNRL